MNEIYCGDIRDIAKTLPAQSVNCIVTSPPYFGLRDYGTAEWEGGKAECDHVKSTARNDAKRENVDAFNGSKAENSHKGYTYYTDICPKCGAKRIDKQIGLEESPEVYVDTLVSIFRELKRVLRDDGSVWLNLGDSYFTSTFRGIQNDFNASTLMKDGRPEKSRLTALANAKSNDVYRHDINYKSSSLKPKNLIGIPWRVAFALQADGWILRSDIIWHKKNPMPESVTDRPTKAHEYIFLLSKKPRYYYDNEAVREAASVPADLFKPANGQNTYKDNGSTTQDFRTIVRSGGGQLGYPGNRNRRTVWTVSTKPYKSAHFAVFPPDLIRPCILAGCPAGGVVFDPFMGSGTVAQVAIETGRNWLGVELNPEYIELANKRIVQAQPALPMEITL